MSTPDLHHLNTPPDFLDLVRCLSPDSRIGLDPCSNAMSLTDAVVSFDGGRIRGTGLGRSWRRYGLVFVNPPHSMSPNNIEPWMAQAHRDFVACWNSDENLASHGDQIVLLVPAKPDTDWFHSHAVHFPHKCFLRGRLKYWQDGAELPGPGKFGSLVLYAGAQGALFHDIFGPLGWCP